MFWYKDNRKTNVFSLFYPQPFRIRTESHWFKFEPNRTSLPPNFVNVCLMDSLIKIYGKPVHALTKTTSRYDSIWIFLSISMSRVVDFVRGQVNRMIFWNSFWNPFSSQSEFKSSTTSMENQSSENNQLPATGAKFALHPAKMNTSVMDFELTFHACKPRLATLAHWLTNTRGAFFPAVGAVLNKHTTSRSQTETQKSLDSHCVYLGCRIWVQAECKYRAHVTFGFGVCYECECIVPVPVIKSMRIFREK